MGQKHQDGYWVNQLTDDNVIDLIVAISSKSKTREFKKIVKVERIKNIIQAVYLSKRPKHYISYVESTLTIEDYKIKCNHSYMVFYQFMIDLFGEEYAEDFLAYA